MERTSRKTVSLVNLQEVLEYVMPDMEEVHGLVWDYFDSKCTWGDTTHSLVGGNVGLAFILDAVRFQSYTEKQLEQLERSYWDFVGDDYIDLVTF